VRDAAQTATDVNGLLLINLGTPDAPTPAAVRRYLREFLSDPRVLDIHPIARTLLLNLVILPVRPRRSAAAYRKIWTERGSPLLTHSLDLAQAVQARLGSGWCVRLGMRYGRPSLRDALLSLLTQVERLVVLPLYPQQASSSTGSSLHAVLQTLGELPTAPPLCFVEPFFDDPGFLDTFAARGRPILDAEKPDHVLFSFHGLPERQVRSADPSGSFCLSRPDCCAELSKKNRTCYRAQSYATARLLAERLRLAKDAYSVSFQSRLGRTPWIRPFTDEVLPELVKQGKRRVVVFCPAFVADCLETLEEVAMRERDRFLAAGGESLSLVPSLNAGDDWADAVVALVKRQIERFAAM
jgi:ferrochelatase